MTLSVVIPVYNEEQNIAHLYEELAEAFRDNEVIFEIIFVNDASTDGSLYEIKTLAKSDSRIRLIDLSSNHGQSYATMQGIQAAKGEIMAILDGDMQNDPHDLPTMVDLLLQGYDMVCGWRQDRKDNKALVFSSRIANKIIRLIFGIKTHDSGCSQKVAYSVHFKQIRFFEHFHRYIPIILAKRNIKITEIIVNHRKRFAGHSKYSIMKSFRVLYELLYLRFFY
jgi:glycosyltransferase involved in cell wall biosynthesis